MKMTISLPEDLADFVKRIAVETKRPRSRVFADLLESKRSALLRESLIAGYQELADENRRFASDAMALATEAWGEAEHET